MLWSLEKYTFPTLGGRDIASITVPEMLAVIRAIEAHKANETARRVRQRCSAVFVHAIASGLCTADPAAVIAAALSPLRRGHFPAIIDLDEARRMLSKVEAESAYPVTKLALRLLALTSVRSNELRMMEWTEIDGLDGPEPLWRLPAERMKMDRDHLVPLSRQAVETINVVRQTFSKRSKLVFPSARWLHRPMSENAMGYLINRAGFHQQHVPHGWRTTFSTIMNETFHGDATVIDLMLSHVKKDKTEKAYNRALHLPRRRELAQIWADMIMQGAPPPENLLEGHIKRPNPALRPAAALT